MTRVVRAVMESAPSRITEMPLSPRVQGMSAPRVAHGDRNGGHIL